MTQGRRTYEEALEQYSQSANISSRKLWEEMYNSSIEDPESFWSKWAGELLTWERDWEKALDYDFQHGQIRWFQGGAINACFNCLDRHLDSISTRPALLWMAADLKETRIVTYQELHKDVNKFASLLKSLGVRKGDRVAIYLPRIPETIIAMLACARIGAIHCNIFIEYSYRSLCHRVRACGAKALISGATARVKNRVLELRPILDQALGSCSSLESLVLVNGAPWERDANEGKVISWRESREDPSLPDYTPWETIGSEDPLFVNYVGAAALKPMGLVFATAGYLLHAAMSGKFIYDLKDEEIIWNCHDISFVGGHAYGVYSPLVLGQTSVIFEGSPGDQGMAGLAGVISEFKVTRLSLSPSEAHALMDDDKGAPNADWDFSSLKLTAITEEIATEKAFSWMFQRLGGGRAPVLNPYSLSEGGGLLISPFPAMDRCDNTGSGRPFFGVKPVILNPDTGEPARRPMEEGALCLEKPAPGMAVTLFNDHERFVENYFLRAPDYFFTGDAAIEDQQGEYRIIGRIDDLINRAGHRIGVPELEDALFESESVDDAAVVGFPDPEKGVGVYAFVELEEGVEGNENLKQEIKAKVKEIIGDFAVIDIIQWTETLPRTPSGKLLRVLLQRIASGNLEDLGEAASIAEPDLLESLIQGRPDMGS
jgi:acetyl-CoA synthetase